MNQFKVGEKVVCINAEGVLMWLTVGQEYTITYLHDDGYVAVDNIINNFGWCPSRFKLKEENHTMTSQQKTKRVPFTHELWEKWKERGGKVFHRLTGREVLQFAYFSEADHRYRCAYLTCPGALVRAGDIDQLELLIPVTTKRIPFNPELKMLS